MRKIASLVLLSLLGASGCTDSLKDSTAPGPVDPGLYQDAQNDNLQRLAGEDHRVIPLYKTPLEAVGVAFDALIGHPISSFFDYITHDTPAYAARKMYDMNSPDNQREGTLRLVDFAADRKGIYVRGYFLEADTEANDYTVRAAGLRALNRCRAEGNTLLFMRSLNDDQPLVRLEAADALSNIPDPQAIPLLIEHMSSHETNLDVRIACAEALRNFHTPEAMKALVAQLEGPDFSVSWQARQSLELLTGQDFRYDPKAWRNYLLGAGILS